MDDSRCPGKSTRNDNDGQLGHALESPTSDARRHCQVGLVVKLLGFRSTVVRVTTACY